MRQGRTLTGAQLGPQTSQNTFASAEVTSWARAASIQLCSQTGSQGQRSEYPLTPGSAHSRDASSHIKNDQQGSIQLPTSLQSGCVSLRALLTLSGLLVPWGNNVKKEKTDSEGFF